MRVRFSFPVFTIGNNPSGLRSVNQFVPLYVLGFPYHKWAWCRAISGQRGRVGGMAWLLCGAPELRLPAAALGRPHV